MLSLQNNPDLAHFRRDARNLLRAARAGDPSALAAVTSQRAPQPTLAAAQRAVARAYGFATWPRLRAYLDIARDLSRDPTRDQPGEESADRFVRLACLVYSEKDGPERWAAAAGLLGANPDLPRRTIAAAAAAADPAAVADHLDADPGAAVRQSGPHRWAPLLYLTYSRVHTAEPADRFLRVAGLLLDAGADPDAGYLWSGLPTPFTVLTGVFGEGEQGAGKQPRHPHEQQLARALLTAGADPNDGQALYNRMFRPDDSHLTILFEFGLGRRSGGPWVRRLGDALEPPQQMFSRQLGWALDHGFDDRVRLLLEHGIDVRRPLLDGRTAVEHAVAAGRMHLLPELYRAGAAAAMVDPADRLVSALLHPGAADADAAGHQAALDALRSRRPDLIHDATTAAAVAAVTAAGFDVDARRGGSTALHQAAFAGDIAVLSALLRAGADPALRDDEHHSTPRHWALYAGQAAAAALLKGGPG